jgi:hypothetical protein
VIALFTIGMYISNSNKFNVNAIQSRIMLPSWQSFPVVSDVRYFPVCIEVRCCHSTTPLTCVDIYRWVPFSRTIGTGDLF